MKTFFRTFTLTLTQPSYYKDILKVRPSFSIKYYLALSSILIIITTVAGIFNYAPAIKRDFAQVSKEIIQDFPPDLVLEIKPQGITANKPFPLVAQTPTIFRRNNKTQTNQNSIDQQENQNIDQIKPQDSSQVWPRNLLIIDPNGQVGMLQEYDALMLLNNSYLIVRDGTGVQTAPIKDFPETRVDFARMQGLSNLVLFVSSHAHFLVGVAVFVGTALNFFVIRLAYSFLFGFGLWLFNRRTLAVFSHGFKVGIHSFTLPILISTTLGVAGISVPIPGWFVIVHILFALYILSRLEKPAQN